MCRDVESNDLCDVCALHTHLLNQHGYISTDTVKPQYMHTYKLTQHEMCFYGKLHIDFTSLHTRYYRGICGTGVMNAIC